MNWANKITIIFFGGLIFLIILGMLLNPGKGCYSIGECKSCWNWRATPINSELCPNGVSCISDPMIEQHNALVDVMICACTNAQKNGYTDVELNRNIEKIYQSITGYQSDAASICTNPTITKWTYTG